jgi:RimJ/RimL family protein N-acetyltransferase
MKTETVVFLKGARTELRPVQAADIPLLTKWVNDPDVRRYVTNIFPVTEESEREWQDSLKKKSHTDVVLVIAVKGKPIGVMGLHRIDWQNRTATTGALIGEKKYWGKGYGTDAKMALLEYAFNTLNLRKIISRVKAFNGRSKRYSEKCGYIVEGRLKDMFLIDGKYWDEIILSVTREQWLKCCNGKR